MRTGPLDRRAEERARRRRRRRTRKRRSELDRSEFEVARLRRQRRRAARRRTRREQRRRRAAHRSTLLQRWRDRPGRSQRAEARLRRALRLNTLRQKLPVLSWYRGLPERARVTRWEVVALALVAAAASVGVATSGKDLTGSAGADLGWAIAVGTVVALAGTRAPRRVLLGCGALAAAGVTGWWSAAGLAAMALSSGLVYRRQGHIVGLRVMHAASAALTLVALMRIPPARGLPSGTVWMLGALSVAALAIAAIVVTGWWNSPRAVRTVTGVLAGVGAVTVVGLSGWLWLEVRNSDLDVDVALVAEGTIESLDDLAASADDLATAEQRLADLRNRVDTPLLTPLRFVPVAAQQVRALDTIIDVGLDLTARAGDGAALVEGAELRPEPGRVDVAAVRSLEAPLAEMVASLESADVELANAESPLLVGPVRNARDVLAGATTEALPGTELALLGVQTVPGMLGADGPRRWLIQLVDTETGNEELQVIIADNGRLVANDEAGTGGDVGVNLGDPLFNPDYQLEAQAAAERYARATGQAIDGHILLDAVIAGAVFQLPLPDQDSATTSPDSVFMALTTLDFASPAAIAEQLRSGTSSSPSSLARIWTSKPGERKFIEAIGAQAQRADKANQDATRRFSANSGVFAAQPCSAEVFAEMLAERQQTAGYAVDGLICIGARAAFLLKSETEEALIALFSVRNGVWRVEAIAERSQLTTDQLANWFLSGSLAPS